MEGFNPIPGSIAEILGTFVFFTVILFSTDGRSHSFVSATAPWAITAGLLGSILAFGSISGGHFNPGVTFLMLIKNWGDKYIIPKSVFYVFAQLLGAFAAYTIWMFMGPNGESVKAFCNICTK